MAYESMNFDQRPEYNSKIIVFVVMICCALGCQLIGCVTPGWYVSEVTIDFETTTLQMGLWFTIFCEQGHCTTKSTDKFFDDLKRADDAKTIVELRAMVMLGIILCLSGLVGMVLYKQVRSSSLAEPIFVVTIMIIVASGSLALAAAGKGGYRYQTEYEENKKYITDIDGDMPHKVPYSTILTGLGGSIAPLAFCLLLWLVGKMFDKVQELELGNLTSANMKY